jgi:hypothetical protein
MTKDDPTCDGRTANVVRHVRFPRQFGPTIAYDELWDMRRIRFFEAKCLKRVDVSRHDYFDIRWEETTEGALLYSVVNFVGSRRDHELPASWLRRHALRGLKWWFDLALCVACQIFRDFTHEGRENDRLPRVIPGSGRSDRIILLQVPADHPVLVGARRRGGLGTVAAVRCPGRYERIRNNSF